MKRTLAALLVSLAASLAVAAQTPKEQAWAELNAGARAYKDGDFVRAQRHFERALELDPEQKNAPIFIARAIHQQYKAGDTSPENVAKGEAAVEAYKRVLERDPANEDAYISIAYLYRQMRDEDREREWLMRRAESWDVPASKRSDAFVILASKQWNCSYDITEQKENKKTAEQDGAVFIRYVKPKSDADFQRARACATEGLGMAERALALAPDSATAWSYKTNLLREMAKLAEMEGDAGLKADFDRRANQAEATSKRLTEEEARARASRQGPVGAAGGDEPPPPPAQPDGPRPGAKRAVVISGGVLNGKAVSKPQPAYPAIARAAGAQGTVTVQVTVDESGRVISAMAVAGHPLLQQAAVKAAREARFTPTLLQGEPVKVTGVVTYNFVLQ